MNGRAPGPAFHTLSTQRRERLSVAIRALNAHRAGGSYRTITEALFGEKRIPDRAWKTHGLRSRTIRPVRSGLAFCAWRLSQTSAARPQGRVALSPWVPKITPANFGIPLRHCASP
ncbi:DUF2285 domain-containing protein [Bradyrhizobium jicamae]|uniref:DUF2285 domain-containing protein n=1 Tax=Bradyrhizobium jicamae TaxID=280332 RepID=UPI002012DE97|nr:DUF2285 domain-containing protein [Bradyrhizobium jicamae]